MHMAPNEAIEVIPNNIDQYIQNTKLTLSCPYFLMLSEKSDIVVSYSET